MTASLSSRKESTVEKTAELHAVASCTNRTPLHLVGPEGQLQVHSAPYRGSFSIVLSQALRAAGLGSRVLITQFLKGGVNQGPQGLISLCDTLQWLRPDIPCCLASNVFDQSSKLEVPQEQAQAAVREIWEISKRHLIDGDLDQLVLDEIGLAISLGYLKEQELISTLEQRPGGMDVILTGPSIPKRVMAMADQITELRCGY